jgi:hypothetical protein
MMSAEAAQRHLLAIGCTGMLRRAAATLGARGPAMTSVARTRASLGAFGAALKGATVHHAMALDWRLPSVFVRTLGERVASAPPDRVLAWIHDDDLAVRVARLFIRTGCVFHHVVSTASGGLPGIADRHWRASSRLEGVDYRQVVLGGARDGSRWRWLTHAEISDGVLDAVDSGAARVAVGEAPPG